MKAIWPIVLILLFKSTPISVQPAPIPYDFVFETQDVAGSTLKNKIYLMYFDALLQKSQVYYKNPAKNIALAGWSPSGRKLAVLEYLFDDDHHDGETRLCILLNIPIEKSARLENCLEEGLYIFSVKNRIVWSPDEKRVTYQANKILIEADINTGRTIRTIFKINDEFGAILDWTSNGQYVIVSANRFAPNADPNARYLINLGSSLSVSQVPKQRLDQALESVATEPDSIYGGVSISNWLSPCGFSPQGTLISFITLTDAIDEYPPRARNLPSRFELRDLDGRVVHQLDTRPYPKVCQSIIWGTVSSEFYFSELEQPTNNNSRRYTLKIYRYMLTTKELATLYNINDVYSVGALRFSLSPDQTVFAYITAENPNYPPDTPVEFLGNQLAFIGIGKDIVFYSGPTKNISGMLWIPNGSESN